MNVADLNAIADRADRDSSEIRTRIPRVAIVGTGFVGSTRLETKFWDASAFISTIPQITV